MGFTYKLRWLLLFVLFCFLISTEAVLYATGQAIPNSGGSYYLRSNQSKVVWFQGNWYGIIPLNGDDWYLMKFNGSSWTQIQFLQNGDKNSPDMHVDALNRKLYIVFPILRKFYRFSFNNDTWDLDSGFPVNCTNFSDAAYDQPPCLARAKNGNLFIFDLFGSHVRAGYSDDDGVTWNSTPYNIFTASYNNGLVDACEFSSGGNDYMGVFVAENTKKAVHFLRLADGANPLSTGNWVEETLSSYIESDNHVSMVRDLDNRLYTITKYGSGIPVYKLYFRDPSTGWSDIDADPGDGTRPSACVDETNGKLYLFSTINSASIGYASTDKDNPVVADLQNWTTIIDNPGDGFNNLSVSYQQVGSATDILVTALNTSTYAIWYNVISINYSFPDNIIISEVNSTSTPGASYVEIYNRGSSTVNLSQYSLKYFNNGSSSPTTTQALSGGLNPDSYVVLARDQGTFLSVYGFLPDFSNSGFYFDGGADGIGLYNSSTLVDRFNQVGSNLEPWNSNQLFNRNFTDNTGSNIYVDYFAMGSNQAGSPTFSNDVSLPVTLVAFNATWNETHVRLDWETASEIENDRFLLMRADNSDEQFHQIAMIKGNGSTNISSRYSYKDNDVKPGERYRYMLFSQDFNGTMHDYGAITSITVPIITNLALEQNYPNPFNGNTTIRFDLPRNDRVSLGIYNIRGQLVRNLVEGSLSSGEHTYSWNGHDERGTPVSSGIYFYRLTTSSQTVARKMIYAR